MRLALVVVVVVVVFAGCNRLLGIDDTTQAPTVDIDADLFSCTPIPAFTTAPIFAGTGITSYASDTDGILAIGVRAEDNAVCESHDGSMLVPSKFMDLMAMPHTLPRLAPAGTEILTITNGGMTLTTYSAAANGDWSVEGSNLFTSSVLSDITGFSEPTAGGTGRQMIVVDRGSFLEYKQGPANSLPGTEPWTLVSPQKNSYTPVDLGVAAFTEPSMSADGSRLVFRGTVAGHDDVYITTRTDVAADFGPAHVLYATPDDQTELTPFMTPDCGRLYFTLGADLYYVTH